MRAKNSEKHGIKEWTDTEQLLNLNSEKETIKKQLEIQNLKEL